MNHENDPFEDFRRQRELREEARTRDQQTRLAQQIFADESRAEYVDRHVHDEMQDFFDESSRKAAEFLRGIHADHEEEQRQRIQDEAEDFLSVSRQQTESLLSNMSQEDLGAISQDHHEAEAAFPRLGGDRDSGGVFPSLESFGELEPTEDCLPPSDSSSTEIRQSLADTICHQETIGSLEETQGSPQFALPEFDVGLEDEDPHAEPILADDPIAEIEVLREENRELTDQLDQLQRKLETLTTILVEKQAISWEDLESEVIPL